MEKIIEQLLLVISKEIDAFNQLLQTLHEKQRAIVEGAIDRLKDKIRAEDEIIRQTKELEAERCNRTQELAKELSLENLDPHLSDIIARVEEKYAQRLHEQRTLLMSLIGEIKHLNKSNQFLLNYSIQFVDNSMRLLLKGNETQSTYQKDGKLRKGAETPKIVNQVL